MVERRDTHCHVDPCVHGEALLFGTSEECVEHLLAAAKSSWLFDGPWAWLFFCGSYCLGLSATNQKQRSRRFLVRTSETERERVKVSGVRT